MSDLDWLKRVVEARTKGSWAFSSGYEPQNAAGSVWRPVGPSSPVMDQAIRDSEFIATMGTHADLILDGLEALEAICADFGEDKHPNLEWGREALTALKAARPEVTDVKG